MIPKNLFFIWLGDNKPNYVDFSVKIFKDVNPDFNVELIRYTIKQIENRESVSKYDHNVYNCLDYILSDNPLKYKNIINECRKYNRKTLQILANILRLDLLNEYGGIYLDCDSFPLKPFDDKLLSYSNFCSYTYWPQDHERRNRDCNFIGSSKINFFNTSYSCYDVVCVNKYNCYKDPEWLHRRDLFFRCELRYQKIDDEYYIDHFEDRTWLGGKGHVFRTPLCKWDKNDF